MRRRLYIYVIIMFLSGISHILDAQSYIVPKKSEVSTNTFNEVAPAIIPDGMVYCTDKTSSSYMQYEDTKSRPMFNIFILPKKGKDEWGTPQLFSTDLMTNQNDGPIAFSGDGKLAVFTRNFNIRSFGSGTHGNPNFGLFFADRTDSGWANIREFEYNDPNAHTTHPSLDSTGTTLYFASDREGGFGGYDLYVSFRTDNGWTDPVNLGPVINSPLNEIYPFIHPSGRLYFSSDGHDKTPDFDLFYSEFYDNRWIKPVKLPAPFNSRRNDFTFYADRNFDSGYYTSDLRGTMDIYSFSSTIPSFEVCKKQVEDNFCYVFYEENTVTLDTTLYVYEWDLGDKTRVRAMEAEHCYSGPGDYMVQLNVIDKLTGDVQFNQAEYLVEVRKAIQSYISCPDTVRVDSSISLNGLESYFGDAVPGEYYWDFGDGIRGMGASITHTFVLPGVYQVRLGVVEESPDPETAGRFCSYKTIVVRE